MLILAAVSALTLGRLASPQWSGVLTFLLASALFVGELRFTRGQQMFGPLYIAEQRYVTVGLYLRQILPENGIVLAIQHSGSARFYTGRPIVRLDVIDGSLVPRAQTALVSAGYHPFAVFEDDEIPQLRALLGLDRSRRCHGD